MKNLLYHMFKSTDAEVRKAFIARMFDAKAKNIKFSETIESLSYERTTENGFVTKDGREIVKIKNENWVLTKEGHAKKLAKGFAEAVPTVKTKSIEGTEVLSELCCPSCKEQLQHSTVCGLCDAGRIGYRHRYICASCGADFVSKVKL